MSLRALGVAAAASTIAFVSSAFVTSSAQPLPAACSLLTRAEIQSAIGATGPMAPAGPFCQGQSQNRRVVLRIAHRAIAEDTETRGIQAFRNMGGVVDVRRDGDITCSTAIPPASMAAQVGYNTTCSVRHANVVAAIEVAAPTQATMVSIARLRPLADILAGRF